MQKWKGRKEEEEDIPDESKGDGDEGLHSVWLVGLLGICALQIHFVVVMLCFAMLDCWLMMMRSRARMTGLIYLS
jgi:hypothetical protein